ncbi:peptidoglycan DD-metalloendopeptidase family protein [Sandaracinus amylolyticus]|uniref:peptidoglycan DD-metalloendopeptidase family protein n=1 Tax=Sandaracinus amylolyticus TaxID=927083 RepID=UPI001F409950|nr:peptidoglycan DD-metalloendopeptidase family protein [Sandaracinus amylolyticus]UJR86751.1 Hypothetical protein I5071_88520 [Sandaracinus amylolyticus]
MTRHLAFALACVAIASCAPAEEVAVLESNVSAAVRRERATLIRDTARAAGITNGLLVAMLAEEETYLSHCASEFPACPGPGTADCGGRAVISGGGDGPCSVNQGGLGMFQIDDGTETQTVAAHGDRVLTLQGNTQVAIERIIQKTIASRYLDGITTRQQALDAINAIRIDDARWDSWIRTLVRYWNGCPESGRCWSNRYPKYDTAARTLYREFGHDFWYGEEPMMPPPAGGGWLASPIESPRITSHVSNRRGTGWARYDCTTLTRANHRGTDFGVAVGTPVHAAAAGTVIRSTTGCPANGSMSSTCGGGFGNHVIVLHDGGYATLYAHFSPGGGQVRNGARVECGDLLGNSGNSGRSSGPHLHFEVRANVRDVSTYFASSATTLDPWGGACSSQAETLWMGGAPMRSCTAMERDDAVVTRATHSGEVRGSAGTRVTQTFTWRNTGTTTWTSEGYVMRHAGGAFGTPREVMLPAGTMVEPGRTVELRVDVTVPETEGLHTGRWRMARVGGSHFGREGTLSVRVSGAPRACNSSTLRRTVEDGECVQVSYPGCGAQSCAWYRCSDGSWLCTEETECMGEMHENASCGEMPANDGGVSMGDGGMCTGGGQPLNSMCETTDDCCEGLECGTSGDGSRECCHPREDNCARHSDCCGSMLCVAGHCACAPVNQLCLNDSECCDGLACIAGACRDVSSCTREAESCGSRSECCYPLQCGAESVGGGNTCCISGGNRCELDDDCCGEMQCLEGRCAYRREGESCANPLDCYGALICRDGTCQF